MGNIGRNEPCHCGSGKKYKKCHGGVASNAEVVKVATTKGFRVSQDFKDRDQLSLIGPVIRGAWMLDPEEEHRRLKAGVPVPERIPGYFLIDTGAHSTSIDDDVTRELSLTPVGLARGHGIAGANVRNVFSAALFLEVGDVHGNKVAISLWKDFSDVKKLRELHDAFRLTAPDGSPMRIIGLLGRDFLRFTKLTYNGLAGSWDMEIDGSILPGPPMMIEPRKT